MGTGTTTWSGRRDPGSGSGSTASKRWTTPSRIGRLTRAVSSPCKFTPAHRVRPGTRTSRCSISVAGEDQATGKMRTGEMMEYRQLGGSGFRVPVFTFGTGTFGGGNEFFKHWGTVGATEATR